MLLHIPGLFDADELARIREALEQADWADGKITAGYQSAKAKDNAQLPETDPVARELGQLILDALARNSTFFSAALPQRIYPPLFNRYGGGQSFGFHVDNAIRYDRSRGARATRGADDWGSWLDGALGREGNVQSLLREPGSALELIDRYLLRTLNLKALSAQPAAAGGLAVGRHDQRPAAAVAQVGQRLGVGRAAFGEVAPLHGVSASSGRASCRGTSARRTSRRTAS